MNAHLVVHAAEEVRDQEQRVVYGRRDVHRTPEEGDLRSDGLQDDGEDFVVEGALGHLPRAADGCVLLRKVIGELGPIWGARKDGVGLRVGGGGNGVDRSLL